MKRFLPDSRATEALGAALAPGLAAEGGVLYLQGELGAGKTTLVRGLLRALGHRGAVRSPTYTLVEPYELQGRRLHHLDLYRLADPEELEFIGIRELDSPQGVVLIEWPERGAGLLPPPDLSIMLRLRDQAREAELGAGSERGRRLLARLGRD